MKLCLYTILALTLGIRSLAEPVVLVDNGKTRVAVYVDEDVMQPDRGGGLRGMPYKEQLVERHRRLARDSVKDLAQCLEKMSGAGIDIRTNDWKKADCPLPVFIGRRASSRFGEPRKTNAHGQGYRLVVTPTGIGCAGQTGEGVSYAIYELLDQLGCRWYIPGEMGEVIPRRETISLPAADTSASPHMVHRSIWYASAAYMRRNRLGGPAPRGGHVLETYLTEQQRTANPSWAGVGGTGNRTPSGAPSTGQAKGRRTPSRIC